MNIGPDEKATKSKMSQLVVLSDKAHGCLGKADLDLSKFGIGEFQEHRLPLFETQYQDAFVVVRLKGTEKEKRQSTQNATPTQSAAGATGEDMAIASSIMALTEDMEKVQKEMAKNQTDQQQKCFFR